MVNDIKLIVENNDDLKDYLLMVEKADTNLEISKEGEEYVLEGTFAEFGTKNNNNRVYDEKDYLPHLKYLQEKMDKKSLMGELDHPSGFSTSLQNVSHIVEKLEYDQASRTIKGRVRILDTPSGRTAKTIIDAGVPVSISSRAAGVADPRTGNVTLKKIVTYDLVADPGFENASLSRVSENLQLMNESYGLSNDDNMHIYKILEANDINILANEDLKNDLLTVENADKDTKNKDSEMEDNQKMVTEEQLQKYSEWVKKVWEGLESQLENAKEEIKDLKETVAALKEGEEDKETDSELAESVNHLRNLVTEHITYVNDQLVETINQIGTATDTNAKVLNEQIEFVANELFETVNNNTAQLNEHNKNITLLEGYSNELANVINENTDSYITDNSEIISKINEANELFESFKNYTNDEIVGKMNESHELFESFKNYTDTELVAKINEGVEYQNLLVESLSAGKLINQKLFEDVDPDGFDASGDEEKLAEDEKSADDIIEKIKEEVEEVEKEKALEESLKQWPFHSVMNEGTIDKFAKLNESKKETVRKKFMAKPLLVESYITKLVDDVLNESETVEEPKWLSKAPIAYRKIYEGLDLVNQERVKTRAKGFNLETAYQINNFWTTSGLEKFDENYQETLIDTPLNEEQNLKVSEALGYSPKMVQSIKNGLKRFNKN